MTETNNHKETENLQEHLQRVIHLLRKHKLVEGLVHMQEMPRHDLVETLVHRQNLAELQKLLDQGLDRTLCGVLALKELKMESRGLLLQLGQGVDARLGGGQSLAEQT